MLKPDSDFGYLYRCTGHICMDAATEYNLGNIGMHLDLPLDFHGIYPGSGISSTINTLGEVFTEWFLFDLAASGDIPRFLHDSQLDGIFTDGQFMDLMCNRAYLDDNLVFFVYKKLPFSIQKSKLYSLNMAARRSGAYCLVAGDDAIADITAQLHAQATATQNDRRIKNRTYSQTYRIRNADIINARRRERRANDPSVRAQEHEYRTRPEVRARNRLASQKYKHNNPDRVSAYNKKYKLEHHAELIKKNADRYYQNHEHCKALARKNSRAYAVRHPDRVQESRRRCYANWAMRHKSELAEYKRQYNQDHATEIAAKKKHIRAATRLLAIKCPALVFVMNIKSENPVLYSSLYTRHQNPALPAIHGCPAASDMDFSRCCILQNPDISDTDIVNRCAMSGCLKIDGAGSQIRRIAAHLNAHMK